MSEKLPNGMDAIARRFRPQVAKVIEEGIRSREVSKWARESGLDRSRFTEIKDDKKPLTFYYICVLVRRGILNINQLLGGRKLEDLPFDERMFIVALQTIDNPDIVEAIVDASSAGVSIVDLLKTAAAAARRGNNPVETLKTIA